MDVVSGIALGGSVLVVLVVALLVVGLVLLFQRRGDASTADLAPLTARAGTLLVRLDDDLRDADNELGYALAQFGAEKAKPYADALAGARAQVAEAFRLRQALDDAHPESDTTQREWTLQIIALCEHASDALKAQDAEFAALRGLEVNAASTLADVRARIADSRARGAGNPAALTELDRASQLADAAEPGISSAGVSAVSATLQQALQAAVHADQLLDADDRAAADLAAATAALAALRTKTRADLVEARGQADAAPDADTGAAILAAIAAADTAVTHADVDHPVAALDAIGNAVSSLDLALAGARNQAQRLEHARTAYAGTLISAKSQIAAVRDLIGSSGGGVSARTRLAEAERQLMLAQNESDPVAALDTIRRAVTHARDADALARYDEMGARS